MKKKTLFGIAIAVAVVIAGAVAAYAYFSTTAKIEGNSIKTGSLAIQTWGGPVNASDVYPGSAYSHTDYFAIQNNSGVPVRFYADVPSSTLTDPANMASKIKIEVTLNPGSSPYSFGNKTYGPADKLLFAGTLADLIDNHRALHNFASGTDPLFVGYGAAYGVHWWLDASADNTYQNKELKFDFEFFATQDGAPLP